MISQQPFGDRFIEAVPVSEAESASCESISFASLRANPAVIKKLAAFVKNERENARVAASVGDINSVEVMQRLSDQANHAIYGLVALEERLNGEGFLTLVTNTQGEIRGFGFVALNLSREDPSKVVNHYFGRAWDAQREGVGSKVLAEQHEVLRRMGIRAYIAYVSELSREVYDRLKVSYSELSKEESGNSKILVELGTEPKNERPPFLGNLLTNKGDVPSSDELVGLMKEVDFKKAFEGTRLEEVPDAGRLTLSFDTLEHSRLFTLLLGSTAHERGLFYFILANECFMDRALEDFRVDGGQFSCHEYIKDGRVHYLMQIKYADEYPEYRRDRISKLVVDTIGDTMPHLAKEMEGFSF